ncbi:MAG: hypothetical protein DME59_09670 [Verrucomicrobia bacterium]|nr:MAG: hypothetical protein DME59_09670 [Verrucomicrobiota bacterium]
MIQHLWRFRPYRTWSNRRQIQFENATVANEHDYRYDVDVVAFVSNAEPKPTALDTSASTPV